MLEDSGSKLVVPVLHGAVLDGSRKDHGVPCLALDLDCVVEELLGVARVLGVDVGIGADGGATILLGEVSQKGHELDGL